MGQTLNVGVTTNFSNKSFTPAVSLLNFTNALGSSATATFSGDQIGGSLLNNLAIAGSAGSNALVFNIGSKSPDFSTSFSFTKWGTADLATIAGTDAANDIHGFSVAETINGGGGDDMIFDSAGNDTAIGGNGDDTFVYATPGFEKGDSIDGRAGSDLLYVGGGGTYDFIRTTISSVERLFIAPLFASSVSVNFLGDQFGGAGHITSIRFAADVTTAVTITGKQMDLSEIIIKSYSFANHSFNLNALGGASSDIIGTSVNDIVSGGKGDDTLDGFSGKDRINSSRGADTQYGGDGNDVLAVSLAAHVTKGETYDGGDGVDRLEISGEDSQAYDFTGAVIRDVERLVFNASATVILDAEGFNPDTLERVVGSDGLDTLQINGSVIEMGAVQFGNWTAKDAVLLGGTDGDDVINASQVRDIMAGQAGADEFAFGDGTFSFGGARDEIIDFESGKDVINLSAVDCDGSVFNGDQAFTLVAAFTGVKGQATVKYFADGNYTLINGDIDGNGKAELQIEVNGVLNTGAAGPGDIIW